MESFLTTIFSGETFQSQVIIFVIKLALILLIGTLVIRVFTKYVYNYLDKKNTQQSKTIKSVLGSIIKYLTYFFMFTAILALFNVETKGIIGILGVGSVAIGLGAQTFIKDVITGGFILFEEQFQVDDMVDINGCIGRVEEIGLRTTILRNVSNNEVYIIPNGEITVVINKTKDFQKANVLFKLKYDGDLNIVKDLVVKTVERYNGDSRLLSEVSVNVFYDSVEPVLNVAVNCAVENNQAYSVKNDLTNDLIQVFNDHDLKLMNQSLLTVLTQK